MWRQLIQSLLNFDKSSQVWNVITSINFIQLTEKYRTTS